jgi:hypothetical protein
MNSRRAAITRRPGSRLEMVNVSKPLVRTRRRLTDDAERLSREFPVGINVVGRVEIDP